MHPSEAATSRKRSRALARRFARPSVARAVVGITACTVALLAPAGGLAFPFCTTDADCGETNACQTARCVSVICSVSATFCGDGNPCTDDRCDPAVGCVFTPSAPGASCSDGNVCNGEELCDGAGTCVGGTPLDCDDGHGCTADSCDPVAGCRNTVQPADAVCRPATDPICDVVEVCDGTTLDCPADDHAPDGPSCDDHNPLTVGEACHDGVCTCIGPDLDGDSIPDVCDPADAPLTVRTATAWPKRSKPGRIKAHGTLRTGVYGTADGIDSTGGFTVTVIDGLGTRESLSSSGAECAIRRTGSIDCKHDRALRLLFVPNRRTPGEFRWSAYLRDLDFGTPQSGPLTVAITDARAIDRVGAASHCKNTETALACR